MAAVISKIKSVLPASSNSQVLDAAIGRLLELEINFVALDFDLTILDTHTGGRWPDDVQSLYEHVRPELRHFIHTVATQYSEKIQMAVVTFSRQVSHVQGIIEHILNHDQDLVSRIPIRGADNSWEYNGAGSRKGKQAHMASAVEELESMYLDQEEKLPIRISKKTSLLIDDDPKNIQYAIKEGVRGLWFNPNKPHHMLREMAKLK